MENINEFDLLEHPLEVSVSDARFLVKHGDTYYMRIIDTIYSKKIIATKRSYGYMFLHVEVDEGRPSIKGRSENVFRFDVPADFYVPVSPETTKIYEDIYTGIVGGDIEDMYKCAEDFVKRFCNDSMHLPLYPIPTVTRISVSNDRKFCSLFVDRERNQNAITVKHGDKIPAGPKKGVVEMVERFADDSFSPIVFLNEVFAEHPVLRMDCIRKMYYERLAQECRKKLTFNRFRSFVPAVAYFMNSGPWYKTWIRFGVDPSKDRCMYRYQVLDLGVQDTGIQLFESPQLMVKLERDSETFISPNYSHKTGFLTPYGIALIKQLLKKKACDDEEQDDEDKFELFD
eukprot:jgi/Antlo1/2310/586